MAFDNLKDKLQFFDPAFHSMTPEGLNSRLTFLQQCMRPGESIPTIKTVNGQTTITYDQAVNTAFGAPPILILRIGDFYNTKIAPSSLSITYEPLLDINPEGIGVQPMIANIQLGFNFLGGSGLKEPVDKLQNALSFNYYANTEMYDERADATDIESAQALDADFIKSVQLNETLNNVADINNNSATNGKSNNETIGVVTKKDINALQLDEGDINYKDFMNVLLDQSQSYFNVFINKSKSILDQYNSAIMQQWSYERYYMEGEIKAQPGTFKNLFGKPQNIEKRINGYIDDYVSTINSGNNGFIEYIESSQFNFSNKLIRAVKKNFTTYVQEKKNGFVNGLTTIVQEITNQQQDFVASWNRLNVLFTAPSPNLLDGFQLKNGNIKIYQPTQTNAVDPSSGVANTYLELEKDAKAVAVAMKDYITLIESNQTYNINSVSVTSNLVQDGSGKSTIGKEVFNPFTPGESFWTQYGLSNKLSYLVMNKTIIDDKSYQDFKSKILNDIVNKAELKGDGNADISEVFDSYWKTKVKPIFVKENQVAKAWVDKFQSDGAKNYVKFTPYNKNKTRNFTFIEKANPPEAEKNLIKDLGKKVNSNTDKTVWNNKVKFN
jgi:hypothetical protein